MAAVTQRTVRTPDGRTLAIEEGGDPAGRPVLVHNGTPNSRHLFAPVAADARAICAELDVTRLAMWGISGGGPYLLACAALLPDLVAAAAALAALAPADAAGLDWFEAWARTTSTTSSCSRATR
jgi:pimeloyl-ACP methyl ester carboxylesterase